MRARLSKIVCGVTITITNPRELGGCCTLAELLEISASPKPGNVHRFSKAEQHGKSYEQFLSAIIATAPCYVTIAEEACNLAKDGEDIKEHLHLGPTIKAACESMIAAQSAGNLLLGHILLLVPLVASASIFATSEQETAVDFRSIVRDVTSSGNTDDVIELYEGIRTCNPGGLGKVDKLDVMAPDFDEELRASNATFQDAFAINKDTDSISHEWTSGFDITIDENFPRLQALVSDGMTINDATIQLYLEVLSRHPDSLVTRKNGIATSNRVSEQAREVLDAGGMADVKGRKVVAAFDMELANAGGKLNPGTTADLTAAALFLLLATGFKI
ncbi:MAG TPA: triphosphoribosyl-dephospho-CoA synthase [Candidatus Lokiarchaeia archaeon]|nr:triphosphoribosyl-dephospho-CoA synthase [Candidatus Lokiarchaeia archaeon]